MYISRRWNTLTTTSCKVHLEAGDDPTGDELYKACCPLYSKDLGGYIMPSNEGVYDVTVFID